MVEATRLAKAVAPLVVGKGRLCAGPVETVDLTRIEALGLQRCLARPHAVVRRAHALAARRLHVLVLTWRLHVLVFAFMPCSLDLTGVVMR